jgi:hypothetical protein
MGVVRIGLPVGLTHSFLIIHIDMIHFLFRARQGEFVFVAVTAPH